MFKIFCKSDEMKKNYQQNKLILFRKIDVLLSRNSLFCAGVKLKKFETFKRMIDFR